MTKRGTVKSETVRSVIVESYANLAMAHKAVSDRAEEYGRLHFMIRAKLRKGLAAGTMSLGSIFDDERLKMLHAQACFYCGAQDRLSADHLVPRSRGGSDSGENLVWACRRCNSSKGAKDFLEWWFSTRAEFPPLMLLRRYLKLAWLDAEAAGTLDAPLDHVTDTAFSYHAIPTSFPPPNALTLFAPVPAE